MKEVLWNLTEKMDGRDAVLAFAIAACAGLSALGIPSATVWKADRIQRSSSSSNRVCVLPQKPGLLSPIFCPCSS